MKIKILLASLAASALAAGAQDFPKTAEEAHQLADALKYQSGEITLPGGLAKLAVPTNFAYLPPADARTVLEKLWRNPPGEHSLGLLLPAGKTPLDPDIWAVSITYADDGYVKDDDANKINYSELLAKMQKAAHDANSARQEKGYPTVELIGWAAPPRYDAATHKLYWAKKLKFGSETNLTLNYDIRILGRRGVLVLSAIAGMEQLPEIETKTPQILGMVNFNDGNRYADFDPKIDKVATYGLAALVAGGIAAKLGFFKLLWVGLLAAKKFIIIGLAACAGWFKKIFKRNQAPGA